MGVYCQRIATLGTNVPHFWLKPMGTLQSNLNIKKKLNPQSLPCTTNICRWVIFPRKSTFSGCRLCCFGAAKNMSHYTSDGLQFSISCFRCRLQWIMSSDKDMCPRNQKYPHPFPLLLTRP